VPGVDTCILIKQEGPSLQLKLHTVIDVI